MIVETTASMELEDPITPFRRDEDKRPRVPEPPPVRLMTIEDAHLPAPAGSERELDTFYCALLRFEREAGGEFPVYRSETHRLIFDVIEPPLDRDNFRALGMEVRSLSELEAGLIERDIQYARQRGLLTGQESIVLRDPAGKWVEVAGRSDLW